MIRALLPAVVGVLLLAGCSLPIPATDPGSAPDVESLEEAIEQETGGQVELGGGATVPTDWPSELPLPPGQLISAIAFDGTHVLSYQVSDPSVGEDLVAAIAAVGFTDLGRFEAADLVTHTLDRDGWVVAVSWSPSDDGVLLTYSSGSH